MLAHLPTSATRSNLELTYSTVSDRHISHNELMWQTPVLAMTAMAFLMTVALGSGNHVFRALAGFLSAVTAVVSTQLFVKHSSNELSDASRLWDMERAAGMAEVHSRPHPRREGVVLRGMTYVESSLAKWRSRHWWFVALLLFGGVSLGVAIAALVGK